MREMTTRERFQAIMNFKPFDRLPVIEMSMWWDKTIARMTNRVRAVNGYAAF